MKRTLGLMLLLTIVCPAIGNAQYLDPGTGSYLFQILIAGGTALLYGAFRFRSYLAGMFRRLIHREK